MPLEMLQAFIEGLFLVLSWNTITLMLVGIALGFAVGILPGLGGPVTLALMLPFVFKMDGTEAFAFLLGMSAVTATTGDITSILFGVPGEAITASTIVDGHPMAKKGEAGRALGAALMSSLVGALFGALCLALAIPIVRPLVLSVTSPEFFMLSVLGVSFLASLSGDAILKGLTAAAIGFQFATVGLDPISGIERYTFGTLYLWDGVELVPATLGLFAIPELIDLAVKGTSIAQTKIGKLGGVFQGVKDTFHHWKLVLRCSAIGAYIGVIPGMGGAVSQWVAYGHAVQSSRDRERFGKGAVEGVLGPGAANNSTLGGALVPTLAFGVPGSVSTAILLGAFIIQGLVPGPPMLQPASQGGSLSLTFSFVWILVISNIITVALCFLFLKQLANITQVRGSLVIPFILLLIYLGGFAENNTFQDLFVVLLFGALGWVMVETDWPRPPLLLGLVLGPLAENNLFLATDNYGAAWLRFPSVIFLFLVILAGVFYPVFQTWRKRGQDPDKKTKKERATSIWQPIFTLGVIVFFCWSLWEARDWWFRARLFPWAIGFTGLALALLEFASELAALARSRGGAQERKPGQSPLVRRRTLIITGWIVGAFAAIWLLGFGVAVPITILLYLKAAEERWLISIALAFFGWLGFYGIFDYLLHVPFPQGQLFTLLENAS
ncbi:MAG TPA: tripartite tricarboxylate transporter permease [Candidatus Eisenbacteria bacterium]|nr:tripartite tricarboxylate transporter permease [Candidatus Eisenbacteria bacterium]